STHLIIARYSHAPHRSHRSRILYILCRFGHTGKEVTCRGGCDREEATTGMSTITSEQALALAPDASSAQAGKKLAAIKHWKNLGRGTTALWGECQGSALYQVRVDLNGMAVRCSCPSRKLPCKHGLGLIILSINDPGALPNAEPPEWVASWLAK